MKKALLYLSGWFQYGIDSVSCKNDHVNFEQAMDGWWLKSMVMALGSMCEWAIHEATIPTSTTTSGLGGSRMEVHNLSSCTHKERIGVAQPTPTTSNLNDDEIASQQCETPLIWQFHKHC